jgi:Ca-activated chloride channel family protein
MLAQDVTPDRLERAKKGLHELANELEKQGGCRVGLIAFAERPALLCPLTTDFRHFQEELKNASLQSVRLREVAFAPVDGTQLGLALERVLALVPSAEDSVRRAVDVLLVSDGGGESPEDLLAVTARLSQRGIAVYTLGIGDPMRRSTIPVRLPDGRPDLVRFQGQAVHTRLLETPLQQIAQHTGGRYLAARTGPLPLYDLLTEINSQSAYELPATGQVQVALHRFQWFLTPAVLLLVIDNLFGRRFRCTQPAPRQSVWLRRLVPPGQRSLSRFREPVTQA